MNQVLHYMQCIRLGDFRLYDYHDKKKNFQKYGSSIPPRYNLSAITTKAIMYYSKDDMFIRGRVSIFCYCIKNNLLHKFSGY